MNSDLFTDAPAPKADASLFSDEPAPQIGQLESFGRGAANNFPLAPQAIAAVSPGSYSQNLEEWNQKAAQAKAANPITYGAGAVTGAMAPLAIPGVGEAMMASPVLANAGLGAASAISNIDLLKNPEEAAKAGLIGGGIGGTVGKVAQMLPGPTELLGMATSPEAVAAKLANPGMKDASVEELTQGLPDVFNKFKTAASGVSDYADGLLSSSPYLNDGAIPKDAVFDVLKSARNAVGGRSDEAGSAAKTLGSWEDSLKSLHSTVSEQNLKAIVRDIDKDINWNRIRFDPTYQPTLEEQGLMKLRGGLDDVLKQNNPEYAKQMGLVEEQLSTARDFAKKFGLERREGEILPSDTSAGRLDKALVGSKFETQRILGKTKDLTGEDLETPLLLRQFKGPTPENPAGLPSKIAAGMVGAGLGHGLGVEGMGLGAVLGHRALHEPLSIAGRRGSEWIMDTMMANPALRSYMPMFNQAAQRGEQSIVANHFTLMQRDPEYNMAFSQAANMGMQQAGAH